MLMAAALAPFGAGVFFAPMGRGWPVAGGFSPGLAVVRATVFSVLTSTGLSPGASAALAGTGAAAVPKIWPKVAAKSTARPFSTK